jgi:hypothetical protein
LLKVQQALEQTHLHLLGVVLVEALPHFLVVVEVLVVVVQQDLLGALEIHHQLAQARGMEVVLVVHQAQDFLAQGVVGLTQPEQTVQRQQVEMVGMERLHLFQALL